MNPRANKINFPHSVHLRFLALVCAMLLVPAEVAVFSQGALAQNQPETASEQAPPKISPEQLDALVAPIALYPDPLLSQALVASTYPLEIIQLQQWLERNKDLSGEALTDAVKEQPWDPSIQAMVVLPDVVKFLAGDIQWTTDLGNAFLVQQSDVMDAAQRMRKKAQDTGALKSNEQQTVETKVVETKTVVVIQPASPEVVYVPSYNPVVVYGPPVYPYPPIYYPPPPPAGAYLATAAITFGVGMAVGAAWGGHYGWGCGWGHNSVHVNVNNNFNRNTNVNRNTGNNWQHNPQHRGGAPYSNRETANKYGGTVRGDSKANRQASARQQASRQGGNLGSAGSGRGSAGVGDRAGGSGVSNRGSTGKSDRSAGGSSASNRGSTGKRDRSAGGSSAYNRAGSGGSDKIGNRDISRSSGQNRSAFGKGSGGYSGSSARANSSRGSSSMGGSRGGGGGRRR